MSNKALHFRGCTHLRQRVIMATLTGRSVKITEIRERDESPGLKAFEASFLRLVDKLTNGKGRFAMPRGCITVLRGGRAGSWRACCGLSRLSQRPSVRGG